MQGLEILRNGKGKCLITDWSGVYDAKTLMSMKKAGYTFKVNGKTVSLQKIEELRQKKGRI